ncbi:MAG TPA: hypothetical protein DDZ88_26515 [Verrucomicrobiales bacterium]|nr:hypothetical protein [Verrucomicrobiales bacterium]
MTAVCAVCDTVFPFEVAEAKAKRRKVKPPAKLTQRDGETLQLEFWTNFRLDRSEAFLFSMIGGVMMLITSLLMGARGGSGIVPVVFLLIASALFYWAALMVFNKTHIEMDEDVIRVTRQPLPSPIRQGCDVSLAGVAAIKCEETAISSKEAYDTPRYRVWAETAGGSRRTIVNDVIEEYAVYIAQRLGERLHMDAELDVSSLEDGGDRPEDEADMQESVRTSQSHV